MFYVVLFLHDYLQSAENVHGSHVHPSFLNDGGIDVRVDGRGITSESVCAYASIKRGELCEFVHIFLLVFIRNQLCGMSH